MGRDTNVPMQASYTGERIEPNPFPSFAHLGVVLDTFPLPAWRGPAALFPCHNLYSLAASFFSCAHSRLTGTQKRRCRPTKIVRVKRAREGA